MTQKEEKIRYKWNDELKNYCLSKGISFIYPLQPMKLCEMKLSRMDLAETLQSIYYKRTGTINYSIGLNLERDINIAKKMNCWD